MEPQHIEGYYDGMRIVRLDVYRRARTAFITNFENWNFEEIIAYPDTYCYVKFYFGRPNQNTFDDRSK